MRDWAKRLAPGFRFAPSGLRLLSDLEARKSRALIGLIRWNRTTSKLRKEKGTRAQQRMAWTFCASAQSTPCYCSP
jgi:hypothetical protein